MRLLMQLLREAGADTDRAFTIVPSYGGYFKAVKRICEYSPRRIVLGVAKGTITLTGENLKIDKFADGDLSVLGGIGGISLE